MIAVFFKEINSFFSSMIGYLVIGAFLLSLGLIMWVFPDTSLLNYPFASLTQLFDIAPMLFIFLISAVTMRTFAEEKQNGTIEFLMTKPIGEWKIILGKYFANLFLICLALIPTILYYFTIVDLGVPKGNIDSGAVIGSYFGLVLLAASFVAIGGFASTLTSNQITSFVVSVFLSSIFYYVFYFVSTIPVFVGTWDSVIQYFGIDYHYYSISKGVIDSRDIIYFISLICFFLLMTKQFLRKGN